MPLLGGLLTNLFSGVVAWLAQFVTRKVAFGIAAVTSMSALTLGLFVVMRATLLALNSQAVGMPDLWVMTLGIAVPPVAPFCFSSYMTIWTACTVYVWQKDLLKLFIRA